jgi:PTH1 family peptidyl-tRNA hydrolase
MRLLVGLGNPGKEYTNTRHNVGFDVIQKVASDIFNETNWSLNSKFHCKIIKTPDTVLIMPTTYMNLSGKAVQAVKDMYKIETQDVWVFHDEMDLEFGRIKIQRGGSAAGHNGIKSIIQDIGAAEFIRWRIGIGKPVNAEGAEYVLAQFTEAEKGAYSEIIKRVVESVQHALKNDLIATMSAYN